MRKFYVVIICLALCQCKPKELSLEELQAFVLDEENGLIQSTEIDGMKISVAYRPTDLWVEREIGNGVFSQEELDSAKSKYSSYYYFVVSLSRDGGEALHQIGDRGKYGEIVQTMSFRMPQYVTLTTAKQDTIPVSDYILNRTYGLSPTTDLLFVFNREAAKDDNWVQFNLNEFGLGLGNHRFRFFTKDLEEVPTLNFLTSN